MIALDRVSTRLGSSWLTGVTLTFGAGVHSLLGGREDGGPLLLSVIAGSARVRRGRVRVLDRPPGDVRTRPRIGRVPIVPSLPTALRVRELLDVATRIRGDVARPADERLAVLDLQALAERPIGTLSRAEARAVALAEAVSSPSIQVLLVEEPHVAMDPRAAGLVATALQAKARSGCAVLVATASVRDAADLADDHTLMRAGAAFAHFHSLADVVGFSPAGARLTVRLRTAAEARAVLAAMAHDASVDAVERDDAVVHLRGSDAVWLARAAASATIEAGVDVVELTLGAPAMDEARAAAAGIAAATYEAAYRRTRQTEAPAQTGPEAGA
jgi:ABC-2 type transport system ATP-binding protein